MRGGFWREGEMNSLWKHLRVLCEIICLHLPTIPLYRVEAGVTLRSRCSECCSTALLLLQVICLETLCRFRPIHSRGCYAQACSAWRAQQNPWSLMALAFCPEPAKIMWYCYTITRHTHTHSGAGQRGSFLPQRFYRCCVYVCVSVWSRWGVAKFSLGLRGMCRERGTLAFKRKITPIQRRWREGNVRIPPVAG